VLLVNFETPRKSKYNKLLKRDKLQLAGSAPLHILANYNLPLNRALGADSDSSVFRYFEHFSFCIAVKAGQDSSVKKYSSVFILTFLFNNGSHSLSCFFEWGNFRLRAKIAVN
jgi:hypothetical protein